MGKKIPVKKIRLPRLITIAGILMLGGAVALGWGAVRYMRAFVTHSPYFAVDEIEIAIIGRASLPTKTVRELLQTHHGENIFGIDLEATSRYIRSRYPEIKEIVINRVLPDTLVLKVRPRKAVAQINLASGFCLIDAEGVVLSPLRGLAHEGLPIIQGIDARSVLVNIGKQCTDAGLREALRLIAVLTAMQFRQEHQVHLIDVSDTRNLSLYIEDGIEVKLGTGDFEERIAMLNEAFHRGRLDTSRIRYIDLRFGDIIVRPR